MDSAWHQFNANPAYQNSYVTRFASIIQQTGPITPKPMKRGPFSIGANNNASVSVGVPEQTQAAATAAAGGLTSNFSSKGKAATVAKSADQGISFFQAAQFLEGRYQDKSNQFYDAVTCIGIDSPGELGNFLNAFGGYGIGFDPDADDAVQDFMFAAQHLAEKTPGTMASFVQGTRQMAFQPKETLANFTSRTVEMAEEFGADTTNAFTGLFSRAPKRELMDEFFSASDAVQQHGKEMMDKFIYNLTEGSQLAEGDIKEVGSYLEYTQALANSGDTEQLSAFLDNPVSTALSSPLFNTGGGSMVVTGIDTRFAADAKTFGVTHSETGGLGVAASDTGNNTAGVSLSTNGFGSGEAVSAVYQTFEVTEGNAVNGSQPANIIVNINHDVRSSTWTPSDMTSAVTAPFTSGATNANRVSREAAAQGRAITPGEVTGPALNEGANEAVQAIGHDAATTIATDGLRDAHLNPDGNVAINAFLVEKDSAGNSRVVAKQEVVSLSPETDLMGLPQSDRGFGINADIAFRNVPLNADNDYSVVLAVAGATGSEDGEFINLSGHVQINEIKVDFHNNMDAHNTGAYQNKTVSAHGTYSEQEVAQALAERKSQEIQAFEAAAPLYYEPTVNILQNRLMEISPPPDRSVPFAEDSETTQQDMLVDQLAPAAQLNNYDFPGTDNLGNRFMAVW